MRVYASRRRRRAQTKVGGVHMQLLGNEMCVVSRSPFYYMYRYVV